MRENTLKNIPKNQCLKEKNSLLKSEKDFIELKDRELKDRKVKIEREIEELCFKPISVSIDHMDWFEKKKWRKKDQLKTLGMII